MLSIIGFSQETLHFHNDGKGGGADEEEAQICDLNLEVGEAKQSSDTSMKNLLKNWELMSAVIIYCIFSLHDVAYIEVIFSYMIMRVTSAVAVQYARMPIISLWPLTLMLSCMWPILICSLLLLSSVIFTLGCEQKKISGLELDNSGCGYCASHLRYIVFFPKLLCK